MSLGVIPLAFLALRSEEGVTSAEYAVMALGIVSMVAVAAQAVGAWLVPKLALVTATVIGGG